MKRLASVSAAALLFPLPCPINAQQPQRPVRADRQIHVVHDRSDEADVAFIFYRARGMRHLFTVDNVHVTTRPVIKYGDTLSRVFLFTGHWVKSGVNGRYVDNGLLYYMIFAIRKDWAYSAQSCEIQISRTRDAVLFRAVTRPSAMVDPQIMRFVTAEMEKPNSAFMARAQCKAAKPWHSKGLYSALALLGSGIKRGWSRG